MMANSKFKAGDKACSMAWGEGLVTGVARDGCVWFCPTANPSIVHGLKPETINLIEQFNAERMKYFKSRIKHGVPGLTIAEQVELWEMISGEKLPRKPKREEWMGRTKVWCDHCGGKGVRLADDPPVVMEICKACDGRGWNYESQCPHGEQHHECDDCMRESDFQAGCAQDRRHFG